MRLATSVIQMRALGPVTSRALRSSMGPFNVMREYRITYPAVVIEALSKLYGEYNRAFKSLIEANREWPEDYQHVMFGPGGCPINFGVQIDMLGLPADFLETASDMTCDEVCHVLRSSIFEIENSLAMYQVLERVYENGHDTTFKTRFRRTLDELRAKFGKPIALLAVTEPKYVAMCESEFGKRAGEVLTPDEVFEMSGFDMFFGPQEFREYLVEHNGQCDCLLYVRSSDPVDKLKNPSVTVDHPLLADPVMRRIIKAHSLTLNIDAPEMTQSARINDTKEYMPTMGMAFEITEVSDLLTPELTRHLGRGSAYAEFVGEHLSPRFKAYLENYGVDLSQVVSGEIRLRGKPTKGTYGCYGHVRGTLATIRRDLTINLKKRISYVIQPELITPTIVDARTGTAYTYIDRCFFGWSAETPVFLGGFRTLMPSETQEAKCGRIHGSSMAVTAEIFG